jgi:membrane-associated phospholipid phosphatase
MDEWANPMFASALWSSRDGTMDPDPTKHKSFLKDDGAPPTLNSPDALVRWDPWVRINLGVTEATRKLDYAKSGTDTFLVRVRKGKQDLVTMTRPDITFFVKQLPMVQSWAELRDERTAEILAQIDNQFPFIAAATGLNVSGKPRTMEWLTVAIQFTIAVESMFKHAFACYRPVHLSPQVQPIITTPGHSSYPMGHAAQAFATVVALAALVNIPKAHATYRQLYLQARRISVNRTVAGVHFPIDAAAGQSLGLSLGEFFVCASGIAGAQCFDRTFTPTGNGDDDDVPGGKSNDYRGDGTEEPYGCKKGVAALTITASPLLKRMVKLARAEWSLP